MEKPTIVQLKSGDEFRYVNLSKVEYVEFVPAGKRQASMLILFQDGEYKELKGSWAELLHRELERFSENQFGR
jgi:TonB family protein